MLYKTKVSFWLGYCKNHSVLLQPDSIIFVLKLEAEDKDHSIIKVLTMDGMIHERGIWNTWIEEL